MFGLPAYQYIAVEGNIGAGKTSLTKKLAADFNAKMILEEVDDNSFLPKFYEDRKRYSFALEMSFLASRFHQLKDKLTERDMFQQFVISDYVFAKSFLFSRITLEDDEYDLYIRLFEIINSQMKQPDLLVYLHSPIEKLKWNITNRGRAFEQNITDEYLQSLNDAYIQFINSYRHLRILMIDCSTLDFVNNEEHYLGIKSLICKEYAPGIHQVSVG